MPLRSEVLPKRWSIANTPILPFLAPRVFQPWPTHNRGRRTVHSSASSIHEAAINDSTDYGTLRPIGEIINRVKLPTEWVQKPRVDRSDAEHVSRDGPHERTDGLHKHGESDISDGRRDNGPRSWGEASGQLQGSTNRSLETSEVRRGVETRSIRVDRENLGVPVQRRSKVVARKAIDLQSRTSVNESVNWRRVVPVAAITREVNTFQSLIALDAESLRQSWASLDSEFRAFIWPKYSRNALRHGPDLALKFLAATDSDTNISRNDMGRFLDRLIRQCLKFGKRHHQSANTQARDGSRDLLSTKSDVDFQQLRNAIMSTLERNQNQKLWLKADSIYLLLDNMADNQAKTFYNELQQINHVLHSDTLLHFASRIAKGSPKGAEFSLGILKNPSLKTIDFDSPKVMSLCTTILTQAAKAKDAHKLVATTMQALLDLGLKVNVIIYNVLVYNAVQSGDSDTAWQIHDMMGQSNIMPDVYTYSILLNDAKWRMDSPTIRRTINLATERGFQDSPYMVTDLLHLMLLLHQNAETSSNHDNQESHILIESDSQVLRQRQAVFRTMLLKYSDHFYIHPLSKFLSGFTNLFSRVENPTVRKLQVPSATTLHVMLSCILWSSNSTQTRALYNRFLELIRQRDKTALELAAENHTWALFLMSLGRFSDRLSDCPQLIKKMLSLKHELDDEVTGNANAVRLGSNRSATSKIPEPNVYTWSVLLHIFTKHKQFRAAEKIIMAMQSRGITPNEVTWTTLAWGYSRAQEVGKVADTIHRMEAHGCTVGETAKGAMFGVLDRAGLRNALAKLKKQHQKLSMERHADRIDLDTIPEDT